MTEKEFRKLVSEQEVTRAQKEEILNVLETIKEHINNYANKHFEIVDMYRGGSLAKGTMINSCKEHDFFMVIKPTFTKVFDLVNKVIINEISNALITSLDNIIKLSDLTFNVSLNKLTFKYQEYVINIYVYYSEEVEGIPSLLLNNLEAKRIKFIEIVNKDYTYFRNAMQIIRYYRDEQLLNNISGYLLEVIMYYSLKEYCFDVRYEDYLNAFIKGLDDFINGKKIEVESKIYHDLEVEPFDEAKKGFTVIDVATGRINLASDVNEITIGDYRKLKKAIAKLVEAKSSKDMLTGPVKLNITINKNNDSTFSWGYKIEGTNFYGNGGSFSNSQEDTYTAIYKALLKGLKSVVDNNLNRNHVELSIPKADALTSDNGLSVENKARRKNVLTFIENNRIKIVK